MKQDQFKYQIDDGIIVDEDYMKAPVKVAFLLKEVNDDNPKASWSLTEELRKAAYGVTPIDRKTWTNVCLWAGLFMDSKLTYQDCLNSTTDDKDFNDDFLRKILRQIATINIKKTPGLGSSDMEKIKLAAIENQELLIEQISEINPDFLICGHVFEIAWSEIFGVSKESIRMLSTGAYYFKYKSTYVLDFCHPAWYQVNKKILFAYAKETISELKDIRKNSIG